MNNSLEKREHNNTISQETKIQKIKDSTKNKVLSVILIVAVAPNIEAEPLWNFGMPQVSKEQKQKYTQNYNNYLLKLMKENWIRVDWNNVYVKNKKVEQKYINSYNREQKRKSSWQDSHTVSSWVNYSRNSKKLSPTLSYDVNLSNGKQQIDFWVEKSREDTIFKAWASTQLRKTTRWYVWVETGKKHRKVLAQIWEELNYPFKSKIVVWVQKLEENIDSTFSSIWETKTSRMKEKGLFAKWNAPINHNIIKEVYVGGGAYKSKNIDYWNVWYEIRNNAFEFDQNLIQGWERGWKTYSWEIWTVLQAWEKTRFDIWVWVDRTTYNSMYDKQKETKYYPKAKVKMLHQVNANNQYYAELEKEKQRVKSEVWYIHEFYNWVVATLWVKHIDERRPWEKDDTQAFFNLTKNFTSIITKNDE